MKLTFLGDVHGKMRELKEMQLATKDLGTVIQVGDLGMGFSFLLNTNSRSWDWNCRKANFTPINRDLMLKDYGIDYFIRGNHDNPMEAQLNPRYLGDYGYNSATEMFWVGGAWSIDQANRIEGHDWWRDEQLSYSELSNAVNLYADSKPRIMVTHDCPQEITSQMDFELLYSGKLFTTPTGEALQAMFEIHQPEYWIFGHYHQFRKKLINGTNFVCVPELGLFTLDLAG